MYTTNTKKKCAVFTIVKNENYFLPIWLKHYKKYFTNDDIYVLDHQSTDGSTEGLDVNVELITNELAFDHQWLVDTVQNFQSKLLEQYESVLFAESDELVYTLGKPLNEVIDEFLLDEQSIVQTCTAKEVMENIGVEKELEPGDEIFKHRNQWFDNTIYHKTLLSKVPLKWVWGFHFTKNASVDKKHKLCLVHLHRCDFNFMLKRHEERATKWNLKDDGKGVGFQHRIGDREGVLKYFNNIESKIEIIPQEHKDALNGI
jgi:hypothetical protein